MNQSVELKKRLPEVKEGILPSIALFYSKIVLASERLTRGKRWALKATLFATLASLFFAFPSYDALSFDSRRMVLVGQQIENLERFWNATPVDNVVFRLTVPVIARFLHLDLIGVLALQFVSGIMIFYLLLRLSESSSGDRVVALFFMLSVAFTYAGVTAFVELRGIFDGIAICLLIGAMWFRQPIVIAILVFAASFTDERAFLAAGFVGLWWAVKDTSVERLGPRSILNARSFAVFAGGLGYLLGRLYLSESYGIATKVDAGRSFHLLDQINNIPMGIWTAFEGGWLIILLASFVLLMGRKHTALTVFLVLTALMMLVALSQVDITRSMAYLLPALVVALHLLSSVATRKELRFLCFTALIACFLWPAYYAGGKSSIWWHYPLPIQVVRWLLL